MRKQLLLFGASVSTAMGVTLLTLTLMLAAVSPAFAVTEANIGRCEGTCAFSNGICRSVDCTAVGNATCGCEGGRSDCACNKTN